MGKKKFLDKKKSAVFTLVYRDTENQDEDAVKPLRQFVRVDRGENYVAGFSEDDPRSLSEDEGSVGEVDDDYSRFDEESRFADADEDDEDDRKSQTSQTSSAVTSRAKIDSKKLSENARLELIELGFPDDGYDYRQHMRSISSTSAFVPSTRAPDPLQADVKAYDASSVDVHSAPDTGEAAAEVLIGSVSAASRPIKKPLSKDGLLDAEILAALESSDGSQFDSADELEDRFVVFANEGPGPGDFIPDNHGASTSEPPAISPVEAELQRLDDDEDDSLLDMSIGEPRERPSRLLDEQFEALALNEYDESDFEEVDEDDPLARGPADISQFNSVLSGFLNDSDIYSEKYESIAETRDSSVAFDFQDNQGNSTRGKAADGNMVVNRDVGDIITKKTLELARKEDDTQVVTLVDSEDDGDGWDCETISTTFSTFDNHPGKISVPGKPKNTSKVPTIDKTKIIRLGGRHQLPVEYLPGKPGDGQQARKAASQEAHPAAKLGRSRAGETPEEKKERKAAVKAVRKEARQTKKDMKLRYRGEANQAQHGAASMGPSVIHLS